MINGWSELPEERRNLVWFTFMVPSTRELLVEWEKEAPLTVAAFRAEAGPTLSDPDYQELIAALLDASPEFAAVWARQDVRARGEATKQFAHPVLGRFQLDLTSFLVAEHPTMRLALYTPANAESERVLSTASALRQAPPPSLAAGRGRRGRHASR
jgi:hypothetical protein